MDMTQSNVFGSDNDRRDQAALGLQRPEDGVDARGKVNGMQPLGKGTCRPVHNQLLVCHGALLV